MKKILNDAFKVVLWVILVPSACVCLGHYWGVESHKQLCVEAGVAEWQAGKTRIGQFKFKGDANVGQAK